MRISHDCRCGFKSAGIRSVAEHLAVLAAHDPFCVIEIQRLRPDPSIGRTVGEKGQHVIPTAVTREEALGHVDELKASTGGPAGPEVTP